MSKHFDLETFTFNGHTLRTVVIDGALGFVLVDIARAIELDRSFTQNVRRFLDEAEIKVVRRAEFWACSQVDYLFPKGSPAGRLVITTESGLYKCVLRAQRSNPAAREFQDWVTKEVLPRIRKNGGYIKDEEKAATGEVSPEQISANLWKFFAAKIAELDAVAAPLRRDAADLNLTRANLGGDKPEDRQKQNR